MQLLALNMRPAPVSKHHQRGPHINYASAYDGRSSFVAECTGVLKAIARNNVSMCLFVRLAPAFCHGGETWLDDDDDTLKFKPQDYVKKDIASSGP